MGHPETDIEAALLKIYRTLLGVEAKTAKADPNKAWRRTGPRRRPRRKEAPATAEEAAARPPSDSERGVLAPLLSSSRGRERR